MNSERQMVVVKLMHRDPSRYHLYEGADKTGKYGCGRHYLTYSAELPEYEPLTVAEVDELVRRNILAPRWDDSPTLRYYRLRS